jgi:uncharacterized protein (DUF952 family)
MSRIYHITSQNALLSSRQIGEYRTPSLDSVGFIHFSSSQQVVGTANNFYSGQHGLVLLVVDTSKLDKDLRWEPAVHPHPQSDSESNSQLFPHLYGPLNLDAVTEVLDFEPDSNGMFSLPSHLFYSK